MRSSMKINPGPVDGVFQTLRDEFIAIVKRVMDSGEFFSSDEYLRKNTQNRRIFLSGHDVTDQFIQVLKGGDSGIKGDPLAGLRGWNYPRRILGLNSTGDLPSGVRRKTEDILTRCFFYGFLYHLYAWATPYREEVDRVDMDEVFREWVPRSVKPYGELAAYDQNANFMPTRVFAYFHEHTIRNMYREWGLGPIKRRRAEAFFKKLFFAGCLLGLIYDARAQADIHDTTPERED
jgi:hypothetical protein